MALEKAKSDYEVTDNGDLVAHGFCLTNESEVDNEDGVVTIKIKSTSWGPLALVTEEKFVMSESDAEDLANEILDAVAS